MFFVETAGEKVSTNALLRETLTAALAFASALSLREFLVALTNIVSPSSAGNPNEKAVFLLFIAVLLFLFTVVVVILWT
jgi:hypothetical protein